MSRRRRKTAMWHDRRKKKPIKERSLPALMMRLHCKGGSHMDRKKQRDKMACRGGSNVRNGVESSLS